MHLLQLGQPASLMCEFMHFFLILFTNSLGQFSLNVRKMKPTFFFFFSKTVNRYKAF